MEKTQILNYDMNYVLIIIAIIFVGGAIWYVMDATKALQEEQDDFCNPDHLKEKTNEENNKMKRYNTEANTMFTDKLNVNLTPLEITKQFIEDYCQWNKYAFEQSETEKEEKDWNIGKSYDNLILKYCSSDKKYQGLAYGSDGEMLQDFTFLEEIIMDDTAIVKVKYQNPEFTFIEHLFEYHYKKTDNQYILDEKYLVNDDGAKDKYL